VLASPPNTKKQIQNKDIFKLHKKSKDDVLVMSFKNQKEWRVWLSKNYSKQDGVWIRFFKKASGVETVVYKEALDEALCFGWIDSLLNSYDDVSYMQKFTPRRKKSLWSKVNQEKVKKLIEQKKMTKHGLKEVELAKQDGRWDRAYDSPSTMEVPDALQKYFLKNKKEKDFFDSLSRSNKYAFIWRLQTAKTKETQEKRLKMIIQMLKNKQNFR
jgi:uncharacterized protein YdeI (YjbR/CyaY-like superfamily)